MAENENKAMLYHSHITSEHKWFQLKLKEVWLYRDLIWLFTKRTFIVQYKQTILGPAWLFINPILTSLVYVFLFGNVAGMSTDGVPQILFYLTSTAIWIYFSNCITKNAGTFTVNSRVFGKVYFPRLTIPISNVLSSVIQFFIQFALVLVVLVYYVITGEVTPNWIAFLYIPPILVHLGLMGMGLGIIISSLTTKYRDLSILVSFGVSLWMYATPIVYPISQLNGSWLQTILYINPVTAPVETFRYAIVGQGQVDFKFLAVSWAFTIIVAILGIMIFNKVERNFMDTV